MGKITDYMLNYARTQASLATAAVCGAAALVCVIAAAVWYLNKDNSVSVDAGRRIDITPAQIQSIKDIGQWEFLSVSDEELVDTVDRGFFRDRELVRIYYGTLRLGIDLGKARPEWIEVKDTTVTVTLPPVELLDRDFIDEARTQPFFESGSWKPEDHEAMYRKAYAKMLERCMTKANIAVAEKNAREQFTQLMKSMGYTNTVINIESGL